MKKSGKAHQGDVVGHPSDYGVDVEYHIQRRVGDTAIRRLLLRFEKHKQLEGNDGKRSTTML